MTPANYWWVLPVVSFLTALIGASAAYLGLVWRYRADFRGRIVEEVCISLSEIADASTEYWLIDLSKKPSSADRSKAAVLSARIWGMADSLDYGIEIARPHLSAIDMLGMNIPLAHLADQLTGGAFRDPTRTRDDERAVEVQTAAASAINALKQAANRKALGK